MKLDTKEFEARMKKSISVYEEDLDGIRVGRANPSLLAKINVDYYGSPTPIQQIAAVAVAEARILTITPWDRQMLKPISKALQTSDIGINPIDDGQVIRLVFPAPTEERRKQLTKEVQKQGEEAKVENILRGIWEHYCRCPEKLPDDFRGIMERDGLERAVTDYVSGMTDNYAVSVYKELFIPDFWSH